MHAQQKDTITELKFPFGVPPQLFNSKTLVNSRIPKFRFFFLYFFFFFSPQNGSLAQSRPSVGNENQSTVFNETEQKPRKEIHKRIH